MSRSMPSLAMRLLVAAELLVIFGWVGLLFTWHAPAAAVAPVPVPMPTGEYRTLRHNIDDQLQELSTIRYDGDMLGETFGGLNDLDRIFMASTQVEAFPPASDMSIAQANGTSGMTGSIGNGSNLAGLTERTPTPGGRTVPAVSQQPVEHENRQQETEVCPYRVSSIICGTSRSTAVLVNTGTGESLFLNSGQYAGDWQVASITDTAVTLKNGSRQRILRVE